MLALHVCQDVVLASLSQECGVHSSVWDGLPLLKELINCLSWFSHLEIKRLMEILWNHELEFMQLHYSLKSELLIVTVLVLFFFPGVSITLKATPGIETGCLHDKKVSAWREKHAAEARITKAKYVCIYMKTNFTQGCQSKGLGHHSHGRELDAVKLIDQLNVYKFENINEMNTVAYPAHLTCTVIRWNTTGPTLLPTALFLSFITPTQFVTIHKFICLLLLITHLPHLLVNPTKASIKSQFIFSTQPSTWDMRALRSHFMHSCLHEWMNGYSWALLA